MLDMIGQAGTQTVHELNGGNSGSITNLAFKDQLCVAVDGCPCPDIDYFQRRNLRAGNILPHQGPERPYSSALSLARRNDTHDLVLIFVTRPPSRGQKLLDGVDRHRQRVRDRMNTLSISMPRIVIRLRVDSLFIH